MRIRLLIEHCPVECWPHFSGQTGTRCFLCTLYSGCAPPHPAGAGRRRVVGLPSCTLSHHSTTNKTTTYCLIFSPMGTTQIPGQCIGVPSPSMHWPGIWVVPLSSFFLPPPRVELDPTRRAQTGPAPHHASSPSQLELPVQMVFIAHIANKDQTLWVAPCLIQEWQCSVWRSRDFRSTPTAAATCCCCCWVRPSQFHQTTCFALPPMQ